MRPAVWNAAAGLLWIGVLAVTVFAAPPLRGETVAIGSSTWAESVTVSGEGLLHTAQFLAADADGNMTGDDDAKRQAGQALANLQAALAAGGARLDDVVKLNLYVRPGGSVPQVLEVVKQRFPENSRPAISLVETALLHPNALVACDAVARRSQPAPGSEATRFESPALDAGGRGAHAALLPAGPRVYVSGQAARGRDLAESTTLTLDSLKKTLEYLGLGLSDVVQVKSFLKPMASTGAVAEWIEGFFGGDAPPMVFVEWSNPEPIEIELIAAAKPVSGDSARAAVEYLTPPGEKASPVFSRIARLNHPATIYYSTLYSQRAGDEPGQIRGVFAQLDAAARRARSDLRHLVKATYYVTTDDVGQQLTDIRRGLYDPERPPAASKATVAGTGVARRVFTMDMIGVPAPGIEAGQ